MLRIQYLTYERYTEIGGTLDSAAFNRCIMRVCGIIDNTTHRRIERMKNIPDAVEYLCADLVDYLSCGVHDGKLASRSQTAGNVRESESYKSSADTERDIENIICDYLLSVTDDNGTMLLYRGCADDEFVV